jgi:hypothetical protein
LQGTNQVVSALVTRDILQLRHSEWNNLAKGEFMRRVGVTFWPVVGMIGFIALVLCGLGFAAVAIIFVSGAPHAIPRSPGIAAILFLLALFLVVLGIVLLRRSIRALSALWQRGSEKQVQRSLYAAAAATLLVVVGAILFPWLYEPSRPATGSVRHGDYIVEPPLRSACGPDAHRIFYRERMVTKVAGEITFSPRNPVRLLYTAACAKDGSESGLFYFDGIRRQPVQVNPIGMDKPGSWFDSFWSPDDKFVLVPAYGHSTLVNLETGHRSDFFSDLFQAKDAFSSSVQFRGWSPDGKKLVVVISSAYMREDRTLFSQSDLVAIDPATLKDTYIATMRKSDGWNDGEFVWIANNGTFDLAVDSTLQNDSTVYRRGH